MATLKEQKDELFPLLQKAMELELSTIPPYLTAWLSIKNKSKEDINHTAAEIIHSVMIEEMLHMQLLANLISSLGGKVYLGEKNIPSYPLKMNFTQRPVVVNLEAFSLDAIETFLKIEKPEDVSLPLGGFEEIDIPAATIGEFYTDIIKKLDKMCDEFEEKAVFCGNSSKQISEKHLKYSKNSKYKPILITNKEKADQALKIIINQGEGSSGSILIEPKDNKDDSNSPEKLGHFFRFREIHSNQYYKDTDKREDYPSGDPLTVDYKNVYPIKKNAKSSDYKSYPELTRLNNEFNRQYSSMLNKLEEAFNGTPENIGAAVKDMFKMSKKAEEMMKLKINDNGEERCGSPSFEWNLA